MDIQEISKKIKSRVSGTTDSPAVAYDVTDQARQSIRNVLDGKTKTTSKKTTTKTEVPFDATKTGIAVNTVLGLPKAALKVGKEILQGTARGLATIGRGEEEMVDPTKTPGGKLFGAKRLFGTDKPFSLASETAPISKFVSEKIGTSESGTQKFLVPFMGALNALDIFTVPGKKKAIIDGIKSVNDIAGARRLFNDIGITDDVVDSLKLDTRAVATKTDDDAVKLIDEVVSTQKESLSKATPSTAARFSDDSVEVVPITQKGVRMREIPEPKVAKEDVPLYEAARQSKSVDEFIAKRFESVEDLIRAIDRPKDGKQGLDVTTDEFTKVNDLLRTVDSPDNEKWRGTIYESYGGKKDVILGKVNDNFVVAELSDSGELTGRLRIHSTPISDKGMFKTNIYGKVEPESLALMSDAPGMSEQKQLAKVYESASSADNSPVFDRPSALPEPSPKNMVEYRDARTWFEKKKDWFLSHMQDEMVRVRRLIEDPRYKITDSSNPYDAEIRFHGRIGTRLEAFNDTVSEIDADTVRIAKANDIDDQELIDTIDDYLVARHAPERNAALGDGAAGIKTDDAIQRVAEIEKLPYWKSVKPVIDRIQSINDETLKILKEGGIITDDLFTLLRTKYKYHVPLQRVLDEEPDFSGALARGFDVKTSGVRKAKGSSREVKDILGNIVFNFEQALIRAEKNRVDLSTLKFVRDNKSIAGDLFEEGKPKIIGKSFDGTPIRERVTDPQTLVLFEKGKPVTIRIKDPELAVALKGIGREKMPGFLRGIAAITRFYSGIHTRFNPEFAFTNKIRDIQEVLVYAAAQSEIRGKGAAKMAARQLLLENEKAVIDFMRGADTEGAKLYKQMRDLGGTTGGMGLSTRKQVEVDLQKLRKLNRSNTRKAAVKTLEYIDKWNQIFEDSSRLAVFRQAIEQGTSPERAAILAKESSINFNKFGKQGSIINSLWMFSNASIQGSTKLIRAMKNPKVAAAVTTAVGTGVYAANEWNNSIDPEWRSKVTTWDRLNGLPVMLPSTNKDKVDYITIPIAWGIKPIKVMFDQLSDTFDGKGTNLTEASKAVLVAALNSFNPAGGTDVYSAVAPTILDMPSDIARNKAWHGGAIRPDWDKNAPASIQYFPSLRDNTTGQSFIMASKGLSGLGIEISPANMNYAFEQLIGGAGRTVGKVFNTVTAIGGGEKPEARDIPFVSRFYKTRSNEEIGQGSGEWDQLNKIQEEASREKFYLKEQAEQTLQQLSNLDGKQAAEIYKKLKETDPDLAKKVTELKKDQDMGLTNVDRAIKALGVENKDRAEFIYNKMKTLESDEERKLLWKEYVSKKIITKEVSKQIKELMKK